MEETHTKNPPPDKKAPDAPLAPPEKKITIKVEPPGVLTKFCDFLMSKGVIRIGRGKEEVGRGLLNERLNEFMKQ